MPEPKVLQYVDQAVGSGATITGETHNVQGYPALSFACYTDTSGELKLQYSIDGVNWDSTLTYYVTSGNNEFHRLVNLRPFARWTFTDTGGGASYFRGVFSGGDHGLLGSPLNSTISKDADATIVRSVPIYHDIGLGRTAGTTIINKFGKNPDIDAIATTANYETLWTTGGQIVHPSTARAINVTSSDITDSGNVLIQGVDANFDRQEETVTLPAANPNTIQTSNTWLGVDRVRCLGDVEGTVTGVTDVDADTLFSIDPTERSSQLGLYYIPRNHTLLIQNVHFSAVKGGASAEFVIGMFVKASGATVFTQEAQWGFGTGAGIEVFYNPPVAISGGSTGATVEGRVIYSTATNALVLFDAQLLLVEDASV